MTGNMEGTERPQDADTRIQWDDSVVASLRGMFTALDSEGADLEACTTKQLAELATAALEEDGVSTEPYTAEQLAELASDIVRDIMKRQREEMTPEELAMLAEFKEQKWRLTATVIAQAVVLGALVVASFLLLRSFDAAWAGAGEVNSWCWWHLRFGAGGVFAACVILGLAVGITAAVSVKRNLPGDGSVGNELILEALEPRTKYFFLLSMLVTGAMCLYGAWHVMSTLGWSLATVLAAPLALLEIFVFGIAAREVFLLFGVVLWYRHCPYFAKLMAFHVQNKDDGGSGDDGE